MSRDAIYFLAPKRGGGWRTQRVLEHSALADRRPKTWRGPFATAHEANVAAYDLSQPAPAASATPAPMQVWLALREDGAVSQDTSVIGVYATKELAEAAAVRELREARDDDGLTPYCDPDTEEEEVDWDVNTMVEGPYEVRTK